MITSLSRFISSSSFSKRLSKAENPTCLKIADIGCGVGLAGDLFSSIHPVSTVYYIDLPSAPAYPNFNSSLFTDISKSTAREYRSGAFGSLPFAGSSIDILIYNASIHHTSDLIALFSEAFRVLSSNGLILITNEHLIPEFQFLFLYLKKTLRQFFKYSAFEAYPQALSTAYILYDGKLDDRYFRLRHVTNILNHLHKSYQVYRTDLFPYVHKLTPFPFTHMLISNHDY